MTMELLGAFGKSFLFVLAALLPILNPAATAPIFLGLTEGASQPTRTMLAKRIARNMVGLLLGSMLIGSYVLEFFGISLPIVRVGGGVIVASMAWGLLNTRQGSAPIDPLFGVPDLANVAGGLSSGATADIEEELRRVITQYEPRLLNPRVNAVAQGGEVLSLSFSLSGMIDVDHQLIPLQLATRLDGNGRLSFV